MKSTYGFVLLLVIMFACKNKAEIPEQQFDRSKWTIQEEMNYPYRVKMLKDLIDNHKLHGLKKVEVFNLLGQPDRTDNGHLFYKIDQQFFPNTTFPIGTKTLVIKLTKDSTVEWRKIHG